MSHVWHGAEITAVDDHIPLDLRSLEELKKIRDEKAELVKHLETELFYLKQPSDLENRVGLLEGAIYVAECGDEIDPKEKEMFLRKFVEDLRDDHHHFSALADQGQQAKMSPHGVTLEVEDHDILAQGRAEAEHEEYVRKHPSVLEPHPDIGRPGLFAENYKLVSNPYKEQGWDYTQEVGGGDTTWHEAQKTYDSMEEFGDRVAESRIGQIAARAAEKCEPPRFVNVLKEAMIGKAEEPIQYGCGDVYVDKDAARATGRALRWQMAEAGLPAYGKPPPVTMEWLKENKLVKDEEDDD